MNILAEQVTIAVTQDDILDGVRQDSALCPIARAIRRAVPEAEWIGVVGAKAEWRVGDRKYEIWLPEMACAFITAFDRDEPHEFGAATPITFTVSVYEVPER